MTLHPLAKRALVIGALLLTVAVILGAFGAHGLKNLVSPDKLVTYETGIRYHFYHAIGLMVLGLIQQNFQSLNLRVSHWSFFVGILLFSFNCYFYVLTGIKVFAMIVPVGGLLFVLGWAMMAKELLKLK